MYKFTDEDQKWLTANGFKRTNPLDEIYTYKKEHLEIKMFLLSTGYYCKIIRYVVTEDFIGYGKTMREAIDKAMLLLREQTEIENASFAEAQRILGG